MDDFDWDSVQSLGVLPDVSMSSPPMQPTTPTGTGTGYYIDNPWLSTIGGAIHDALNYAIVRDQTKIARDTGMMYAGAPLSPSPQLAAQQQNGRIILLGGVVIALAFILRGD